MNRKEFQKWLDQFPEDTEIEVVVQQTAAMYQAYGECAQVSFTGNNIEEFDFVDFTKNPNIPKNSPVFGKRVLVLGQGD